VEKTEFVRHAEECSKCYFFDMIAKTEGGEEVYICRRGGPHSSAALIGVPGKGGIQIPQWMYTSYWDRVTHTDWCDRFKAKVQQ
jgi:hypothetical protein